MTLIKNNFSKSAIVVPKTQIPIHQLMKWNQEANELTTSLLGVFHKSKLSDFLFYNKTLLEQASADQQKLIEAHFVMEEGQPKFEVIDEKQTPVLLEGKTQEDYNKAFEAFMNTMVGVRI